MRPHYPTRLREQMQSPDTSRKGAQFTVLKDQNDGSTNGEVHAEYSIKCEELHKYVLRGGFHVPCHRQEMDKFANTDNYLSRNDFYMKLWISPRSRLSIFLSSTWIDVSIERDLLLQKIYPKIASIGKQSQIEVSLIEAADVISDSSCIVDSGRIWNDSAHKIVQCFLDSDIPFFFISLISERYGYCSLPRSIQLNRLDYDTIQPAIKELALIWYNLDNNELQPDTCILKGSPLPDDHFDWKATERIQNSIASLPTLRDSLAGLPFDHLSDLLITGESIVEWEIILALALSSASSLIQPPSLMPRSIAGILWVNREFDSASVSMSSQQQEWILPEQQPVANRVTNYFDSDVDKNGPKLSKLKKKLSEKSSSIMERKDFLNLNMYSMNNKYSALYKQNNWHRYLVDWEDFMENRLLSAVQEAIRVNKSWAEDGCGVGLPGVELEEMLLHSQLASIAAECFVARAGCLDRGLQHLRQLNNYPKQPSQRAAAGLCPIALCIVGGNGSGKRFLATKLAAEYFKYQQTVQDCKEIHNRPVLIRFCGASSGSRASTPLLRALCRQIELIFSYSATTRGELDGIIHPYAYFQHLASKHPIVLFICGVDKLVDSLTFIHTISGWKLHPYSQIVFTLDSHSASAPRGTSKYGHRHTSFVRSLVDKSGCTSCDVALLLLKVPRITLYDYHFPASIGEIRLEECEVRTKDVRKTVTIESMSSIALTMLDEILKQKGRKLSQSQHKYVQGKLQNNPHTTYTALVSTVCQYWKDNTFPSLENDVFDLVHHLVDRAESVLRGSNSFLLRFALGLLATSLYGLTVEEMEDLTLMNRAINLDFTMVPQKSVIRDLLISTRCIKQVGARLQFTHEQVKYSIASTLSEMEKVHYHRLLGVYFSDLIHSTIGQTYSQSKEQLLARLDKVINHANRYKGHVSHEDLSQHRQNHHAGTSHDGSSDVERASSVVDALVAVTASPRTRFESGFQHSNWCMKSVSFVNVRRCEAAVHHLLEANLVHAAFMELCNIDSIISRVTFGQHWEVKEQLGQLLRKVNHLIFLDEEVTLESLDVLSLFDGSIDGAELEYMYDVVDHYYRWLMGTEGLNDDPGLLSQAAFIQKLSLSCSLQPISSTVRKEFYQRYYHSHNTPNYRFKNVSIVVSDSVKRCFSIGGSAVDFDAKVFDVHSLESSFHTCAWSPCDNRLAAAGQRNDIYLLSMTSGGVVGILYGHQGPVTSLSWSPIKGSATDSLLLASSSSDCTVKIWNPETGRAILTLTGHKSAVLLVMWQPGPSFTVASASADNTIRLWNGLSGHVIHVLMTDKCCSPCIGLAFYKRKKASAVLISASGDGQVILWDVQTGSCIAQRRLSANITSFHASRDGRRLACGQEDGQIRILDTEACLGSPTFEVASGKEEEEEEQKDKALVVILSVNDVLNRSVAGISFSYDGRSLLAAYRATSTTTPPIETSPRVGAIVPRTSTSSSSKGHTVGINDTITIYQWDVSSGKKLGSYYNERSPAVGNDDVTAIQMSPDGKQFVSCYASGSMSLWNYFKVPPIYKEPPRHFAPVRFVSWMPLMFCKDSKRWTVPDSDMRTDTHDVIASGDESGCVYVWDVRQHALLCTMSAQPRGLSVMAWCPTAIHRNDLNDSSDIYLQLAIATPDDSSVALLHIPITSIPASDATNSSDARRAVSDIGRISSEFNKMLSVHTKAVRCLEYCSYANLTLLASGSEDSTIRIWNTADGSMLWALLDHHDCIHSLSWSPDGLRLASGSGDYCEPVIGLWDASSLIESCTSADSSLTAAVSSSPHPMVLLNNLLLGHHSSEISSLRWSPDSQKLLSLSCSRDCSLALLWDFEATSRGIIQGGSPDDPIVTGSWSSDSLSIALTMKSGEVQIFDCKGMSVVWILSNSIGSAYTPAMKDERNQLLQGIAQTTAKYGAMREVRATSPPLWGRDGLFIIYGCNNGTLTFWDSIQSSTEKGK